MTLQTETTRAETPCAVATQTAARLTATDWNEEWKALQVKRAHPDDPTEWDERSKTFPTKHGAQTDYVARFLEFAGIQPGETVLDMGCGTGALATPLAQAGCHVIAADFSQGMLDVMRADQAALGVTDVNVKRMSWADDWDSFGLGENSVDVALASRSIATADLQDSLLKLTRTARRRACITLPCGSNPRIDESLLEAAGFRGRAGMDFAYAFNILLANGLFPEVRYIDSPRSETFDSREEAFRKLWGIVESAARDFANAEELDAAKARFGEWLDANLVENERAGESDERGVVQGSFKLARERHVIWAFLAWATD